MKKYIVKFTLFTSSFLAIYAVFFYCVEKGLKKSDYLDFEQWNDVYEGSINADILIQGSSRAWRMVDPEIIDSATNLNSYNLGMDGYQIPMQIARYDIYKRHNKKPKIVIHIVDHFSLTRRSDLFNRDQFLPYLNDTILTNELNNYTGFGWGDYNLPYYRYIGSQECALAGLMEFFNIKNFASTRYKGFQSQMKEWENDFDIEQSENPKGKRIDVSSEVCAIFENYLYELNQDKIMTYIVYAPEYRPFQEFIINRDSISNIYSSLASAYNCQYIDYSNHPLCFSKEYFYNPTHLNKIGAQIFSTELAKRIK